MDLDNFLGDSINSPSIFNSWWIDKSITVRTAHTRWRAWIQHENTTGFDYQKLVPFFLLVLLLRRF